MPLPLLSLCGTEAPPLRKHFPAAKSCSDKKGPEKAVLSPAPIGPCSDPIAGAFLLKDQPPAEVTLTSQVTVSCVLSGTVTVRVVSPTATPSTTPAVLTVAVLVCSIW